MIVCVRVCKDWKDLIYGDRKLNRRRIALDPRDNLYLRSSFSPKGSIYDFCVDSERRNIFVSYWSGAYMNVFNLKGEFLSRFKVSNGESETYRYHFPQKLQIFESKIYLFDLGDGKIQVLDTHYDLPKSFTMDKECFLFVRVTRDGKVVSLIALSDHLEIQIFYLDGVQPEGFESRGRI